MPPQKFVLRLLDAGGTLLGWTEARVAPRSGGRFVHDGAVRIPVEAPGVVHRIAVHWCDLDIDTWLPWPSGVMIEPVRVGDVLCLPGPVTVMMVHGTRDVPRPPVTVRSSVVVTPPSGTATATAG